MWLVEIWSIFRVNIFEPCLRFGVVIFATCVHSGYNVENYFKYAWKLKIVAINIIYDAHFWTSVKKFVHNT